MTRSFGRHPKTASPAKAGVHPSTARTPERWIPAFAGTAGFFALAVFGFVFQGVTLLGFIFVSRTTFAEFGKPVIIALAFGGMAVLVGYAASRSSNNRARFVSMPAVLAVGFVAASDLLAVLWFPGLRKDIEWGSIDYFRSTASAVGCFILRTPLSQSCLFSS